MYALINWVIGSCNGLLYSRRQTINWTNADLSFISREGACVKMLKFPLRNMYSKISAKCYPCFFSLSVLRKVISENQLRGWVAGLASCNEVSGRFYFCHKSLLITDALWQFNILEVVTEVLRQPRIWRPYHDVTMPWNCLHHWSFARESASHHSIPHTTLDLYLFGGFCWVWGFFDEATSH